MSGDWVFAGIAVAASIGSGVFAVAAWLNRREAERASRSAVRRFRVWSK